MQHSYYKHHVFFCVNQRDDGRPCCQDHRAAGLRDYMKRKVKDAGLSGAGSIRINQAGCLDRCDCGPVMVIYPEAVWYTYMDEDDLDEIFDRHLQRGEVVERLKLTTA